MTMIEKMLKGYEKLSPPEKEEVQSRIGGNQKLHNEIYELHNRIGRLFLQIEKLTEEVEFYKAWDKRKDI